MIKQAVLSLTLVLTLSLISPTFTNPNSGIGTSEYGYPTVWGVEVVGQVEILYNGETEYLGNGQYITTLHQPTLIEDSNGNLVKNIIEFDSITGDYKVNTLKGNIIFDSNTCKQIFLPIFNPITDGMHISTDEAYQKLWKVEKKQGNSFIEFELEQPTCTLSKISNSTGDYILQHNSANKLIPDGNGTLVLTPSSYIDVITRIATSTDDFKDTAIFNLANFTDGAGKEYTLVETKTNVNFNKFYVTDDSGEKTETSLTTNSDIDGSTFFTGSNKVLNFEFGVNNRHYKEDLQLASAEFSGLKINSNGVINTNFYNGAKVLQINEQIVVDPEFSSDSATTDDTIRDSDNNGLCDVGSNLGGTTDRIDVGMEDSASTTDCYVADIEWDVLSIPDDAIITSVVFGYEIKGQSGASAENIIIGSIDFDDLSARSVGQRFTSIEGGTEYFTSTTEFDTVATDLSVTLNAQAISDLQTAVTSGDTSFAIGFFPSPATQSASNEWTEISSNEGGTPTPTLTVTYTLPSAHATSTLDTVAQTTDTAELVISWTEDVTNFDNATQPIKANNTVWTGETFYLNTPLQNQDATQNSDNSTHAGSIDTSSNFEGIFHFNQTEPFEKYENALVYYDFSDANGVTNRGTGGSTYDGTNNGATTGATGNRDEAYDFDGTNDYIVTIPAVTVDNADWTVSAWINSDVSTTLQVIINSLDNDFEQEDFQIRINTSNTFDCIKRTDNTTSDADMVTTSASMTTGNWFHVVCVYDDSVANDQAELPDDAIIIYINGVMEDNSATDTNYNGGSMTDGIHIGHDLSSEFNGKIDDVSIYSVALSSSQITELYEQTVLGILDYSGDDNHAIIEQMTDLSLEDDLSSDNFVDQDSASIGVSGGVLNFDMERDDTNDASSLDLRFTLDNEKFVLRYKLATTTFTQGNSGSTLRYTIGLSDQPSSTTDQGSHDFIGLQTKVTNTLKQYHIVDANDATLSTAVDATFAKVIAVETLYIEMKRTSAISYTVSIFSDADYSTLVEAEVGTIIDGETTGLRYFWIGNLKLISGGQNHSLIGTIDDIKIYNGVTEISREGTATISISSIDTAYTNEVQFTNAGLNITSTSYPELQQEWTINIIAIPNQTTSFPLMSWGSSAGEILINFDDSFLAMSINAVDIFNFTKTMISGNAQAISISRTTAGVYEVLWNGTGVQTVTDTTTLGTVTNDLYHIGMDTDLTDSGIWRLEELSIKSTDQSTQDNIDFGVRIVPMTILVQDLSSVVTYTDISVGFDDSQCYAVTTGNSALLANSTTATKSNILCGTSDSELILSAPQSLIATSASSSSINLSWSAPVTGTPDGYRIDRESPSGNGFNTIVADTGTTITSYTDSSLTLGIDYNYVIYALDGAITSIASNEENATPIALGGGGGGDGGVTKPVEPIILDLVVLSFVDDIHKLVLGEKLKDSLTANWNTATPMTVTSIIVADSPLPIKFTQIRPFDLSPNPSAVSSGELLYELTTPSKFCANDKASFAEQRAKGCIIPTLYEVQVQVIAEINGEPKTTNYNLRFNTGDKFDLPLSIVVLAILLPLLVYVGNKIKKRLKHHRSKKANTPKSHGKSHDNGKASSRIHT